jgi:hypothetical protein
MIIVSITIFNQFSTFISYFEGVVYLMSSNSRSSFRTTLKHIKSTTRGVLFYSLPSIVTSIVFLIAFYPGIMTNDSFNQWMQAHSGKLYNWHPVPHTLFIFLVTSFWDSPAAIALSQAVIASIVIGYMFFSFEKLGIRRKYLIILSILYGINPVNAVMQVSIWKDVLYNSSLILLTVYLANILWAKGNWITNRGNNFAFIFTSSVLVLFRHNGIIAFTGTLLLAFILLKEYRNSFILIFLTVAAVYVVVKGPVYNYLKVMPGTPNEAFAIPTQQIAAVVKNKGNITEQQKKRINKIMPLQVMAENYHPYSVDLLKFHKQFNRKEIEKDKAGFLRLWFQLCLQNPEIAKKAFLNQTSLVWQVKQPGGRGYTYTVNRKVVKNHYKIRNVVLSPGITSLGNKLLDFTERKDNKWLFWRPALPLYAILIFSLAALLRTNRTTLLLLTPILLNVLSILIAIPAQDYRYLHANNAVAVIVFLFFLLSMKNEPIS